MAYLAAITVYPLKSFCGQPVRSAAVLSSGALEHDRRFALFDEDNRCWNAKRTPRLHGWRTWLNVDRRVLTLHDGNSEYAWQLDCELTELQRWFAQRLAGPVLLAENSNTGFPDDLAAPGPTVVSTASLEEVARWFPELTVDDVRQRFRANLEIGGVPPFWEDRLLGTADAIQPFRVGNVVLGGVNPCQRCVVPTRDPATGQVFAGFQRAFAERRESTLPEWAPRQRFNHYYRFTVNTRLLGAADKLQVGDTVEIIDGAR
jgi:uncharacterized protein YcbX